MRLRLRSKTAYRRASLQWRLKILILAHPQFIAMLVFFDDVFLMTTKYMRKVESWKISMPKKVPKCRFAALFFERHIEEIWTACL